MPSSDRQHHDDPESPLEETSSTDKTLSIPVRKSLPPAAIPERTSSKRTVSQTWDDKFSNLSTAELNKKLEGVGEQLRAARKKLKRRMSMDEEYWDRYLEVSQLQIASAQVKSQIELKKFEATPDETWYDQPAAHDLKLQHDSWTQWESIMKRHKKRMQSRIASGRESFVRLFTTSKVGFNLQGGQGERCSSLQSNMRADMFKVYCPDRPVVDYAWEPVLHKWFHERDLKAAHLFPWAQGSFMDDIFGEGSHAELFSPLNGLFLHLEIEKALEKGHLAIVPDVNLVPANLQLPLDDQQERQDRVREWEQEKIKNYKIIVINKSHKEVTKTISTMEDMGITALVQLHERKLVFETDFRPRARYIWWTFLNTILRKAWGDGSGDQNVQHEEVRRATRYWGTRRSYVKRNQLLGFVEEMGQDVESILTNGSEEEPDGEGAGIEATQALVEEAMVNSAKRVNEDGETDEDSDGESGEEDSGEE